MNNSPRGRGWRRYGAWIGVLVCLALAQGLPRASHAAGTTVTTFYATTRAAYDAWAKTNYAPPPRVATFPSGTTMVAFYLAYQNAVPKVTQFEILVHAADGSAAALGSTFTVNAVSSVEMDYLTASAPGGYAQGTYTTELLVNGAVTVSTTFSVEGASGTSGAQGPPSSNGAQASGGPATSAQEPSIPTVYTSSAATAGAWSSFKYQPPPLVTSFFSGTTTIAIYFVYLAAAPGSTSVGVAITNQAGAVVAQIKPFIEPQFAGSSFLDVGMANKGVFADGTYTAEVLLNGKVANTYKFKVGIKPSSAYILFYPTSQAATKAWASTKYMPLPQVATFPAGTTTVALYFEYQDVIANADYFQPVISDQSGKTFFTGTSTFFTDDGGEQWIQESPKGGFPNGTYQATLYVDALPAVVTTFTVG